MLALRKMTLNTLAEHFEISRPAISKHVKHLAECGLVEIVRNGRERVCQVQLEKLDEVRYWVEHYRNLWENRLDALDEYLKELK